jgi:hypothetical protein
MISPNAEKVLSFAFKPLFGVGIVNVKIPVDESNGSQSTSRIYLTCEKDLLGGLDGQVSEVWS